MRQGIPRLAEFSFASWATIPKTPKNKNSKNITKQPKHTNLKTYFVAEATLRGEKDQNGAGGDAKLAELIQAGGVDGAVFRPGDRREQHGRDDANDGEADQQFEQGEGIPAQSGRGGC